MNLIKFYFEEKRIKEIEQITPDLLLQASVFPKKTAIHEIIEYFSKSNFGEAGKEFEKVMKEIEKGASVESALESLKKRVKSKSFQKVINLLIQGYESGAEMNLIFREAAENLLETQSILEERKANLVIEKYTLLFAGGIIVPIILGLIVKMVSGLETGFEGISFGMPMQERKQLIEAALISNQIYIGIYALMASIFVGMQESNMNKAIIYTIFLLPLSLIFYNLVQVI